jgi:Ca-activated chloride channel family protein
MIRLANPSFLLIGLIFLPLFFKRKVAFLGYSHLHLLEADRGSRFWQNLPQFLSVIIIALLVLGLARPQWKRVVKREKFLTRDILLVMDLSYSMENALRIGTGGPRKIDVAKKAALQFIQKRENDRIGLLVFGDETFGSWPLTRDLNVISKKVDRLGSTFYGGTNLVRPFVKVMDHFREMGQSANRILVFLSDGEAVIHARMKEMIIREIKKMNVHLYLLGINLKTEESDLFDIVNATEGRFIATESESDLTAAFNEIDHLEPSMIEIETQGESQELYPLFALLALGLMFILILVRNTLFIELC